MSGYVVRGGGVMLNLNLKQVRGRDGRNKLGYEMRVGRVPSFDEYVEEEHMFRLWRRESTTDQTILKGVMMNLYQLLGEHFV